MFISVPWEDKQKILNDHFLHLEVSPDYTADYVIVFSLRLHELLALNYVTCFQKHP